MKNRPQSSHRTSRGVSHTLVLGLLLCAFSAVTGDTQTIRPDAFRLRP